MKFRFLILLYFISTSAVAQVSDLLSLSTLPDNLNLQSLEQDNQTEKNNQELNKEVVNGKTNQKKDFTNKIVKNTPKEVRSQFREPLKNMIHGSKTNLLRIIHYPPFSGKEDNRSLRAAAHEDINLITLLVAGTRPGLEAKDNNGTWHKITTDPGTIIVNIGDMLEEVSGGYYPSTTHRVVNPEKDSNNDSRYSMPLFLHPRNEVVLSKKYTAGNYLNERLEEIGLKK